MAIENSTILLHNESCDIAEYRGSLIVTYLAEDKTTVKKYLEYLDRIGCTYYENCLDAPIVLKDSYVVDMQDRLQQCGCYLLFLCPSFETKKNRALRNQIWYQIGSLHARNPDAVVIFKNKRSNIKLLGTPLQSTHVISTLEEMDDLFKTKFQKTLSYNEFYKKKDMDLNIHSKKRLYYRKLIISLKITKESYQAARELYNSAKEPNQRAKMDLSFKNDLHRNLCCGIKLLSFGFERKPQFVPYLPEMNCKVIDYPEKFDCTYYYRETPDSPNHIAEILFEIILPVHHLLGVNFKIFVGGKTPRMRSTVLQALFAPNFTAENDAVENVKAQRLYFSLNMPHAPVFDVDSSLNIGKKADYLYPQ